MNFTDLRAIKCKTCGEPLDISKAQGSVIKCAVCDSVFTLPKEKADPKVLDFLSQGEHELDIGKFEDAYSAFNKAAELDKTEPEAYWGMALAEFKIQYLKDEVNNRLQPICHEVTSKDFSDNVNFLKATLYATDAQRNEYKRKGEEINYIKNEFLKVAQTGLDYDCFICVKVTDDNNGGRTQDYKAADDIYFELKGKGYKPFFSERELVGVTGADYEARILYALKSSECMLVVCFDEAYLRTKWVKNEYTRFLKLVNDEEKESDSIALVFGDRPVEKLPGKKGKIQGIALNSLTAMERIVQFVDSHTPEARKRREEALRKKEEDAKRKAQEDEVLRQRLAELENRLKNQPQATLSDEELFERMERARQEKERKEREAREAAERARIQAEKERQERERKERERKEAEERARQESARKEREARETAERARLQAERERLEKVRKEREEAEFYAKACKIENGVLINCYGRLLRDKLVIPNGVTSIGEGAVSFCFNLVNIFIPDSVTIIGNEAFSRNEELTNINIPDTVTSIGDRAFWGCHKLKNIKIPSSVTFIGSGAFSACGSVESITVDADNPNYISVDNCLLTRDGKTLIAGCKNSTIPESVMNIGDEAFNCFHLNSITIPDTVISIGQQAYSYNGSVSAVIIPDSVKKMGNNVFEGIDNLVIYCRAKRKPFGWNINWNKKSWEKFKGRHKVIWGYTGN